MFKDAIPGAPQPRRVTRPMDFIVWFLVLLFVFAVASRGNAHGLWEGICCSDRDCEEVPDSAVSEQGEDIVVTLMPGQHPLWGKDQTTNWTWTYKRSELRKPVTGKWGVCKSPSHTGLCLYPPMRGF